MLSRSSSSRRSKPRLVSPSGLVRLAAVGPLVAVLALAGCGSSSKSGDTCTTDADCSGASQCDLATKTCTGGGAGGASGSSSSTGSGMQSGFDPFQEENLKDINMYRATLKIAPVVLDQTLTTFALAGTLQETMDHSPHAHFLAASANGSLWKDGFTSQAGENQGDPTGWPVLSNDAMTNELDQVDAVQKDMFDEGPGPGEAHGHYENIMNAAFKRVGIGLMEVDKMLYLTNDFSN